MTVLVEKHMLLLYMLGSWEFAVGGLREVKESERREPLGNHQFAAILLFNLERAIQSKNRAGDLVVSRRLRGDPLQPQSWLG